MEFSSLPLAELRRLVREAVDEAAQRDLADALREDTRAGARALAAQCERRLAKARAEKRRLAGLFERRAALLRGGARWVAGIDEVGVGPLAGPVVAAAVVLPTEVDLPGLNDSKRLDRRARERLAAAIRSQALGVAVAEVAPAEIDRLNIYHASLEAMRLAVLALTTAPDHLLVDARTVPGVPMRQTPIVNGDATDGSIAAASIVAKVYRDALMARLDETHPGYGFRRHKGYPTPDHLEALGRLGPCPIHRRSFAPVARASRGSSPG